MSKNTAATATAAAATATPSTASSLKAKESSTPSPPSVGKISRTGISRKEALDLKLLPRLSSQPDMRFAVLALVMNLNDLNIQRLLNYIYQVVKFSPGNASAIDIAIDPLAPGELPTGISTEHSKPISWPAGGNYEKLVQSLISAHMAYLASAGSQVTEYGLDTCYFSLGQLFLTAANTGSSKSDDKTFERAIERLDDIKPLIGALRLEQETLIKNLKMDMSPKEAANASIDTLLEAAKKLPAERQARFSQIIDQAQALVKEQDELLTSVRRINTLRQKTQLNMRDSINFFKFTSIANGEISSRKVTDEPLWTKSAHMLSPYGFLAACLDDEQIAFKVTIHTDMDIDSTNPPFKEDEYYTAFMTARRATLDALLKGTAIGDIKRHTYSYYFWIPVNQLSEFTDLIMSTRANLTHHIIKSRQLRDAEAMVNPLTPADAEDTPAPSNTVEEFVPHLADSDDE